MKLNEMKVGRVARIKKVETKCNCVLRIMTLGLVEGVSVKYISSTKTNMELSIYGSRIVISKHCASHIII